jgi:ubiquinone/menaquinone biosynthesis C-methylase UbiE
MAVLPTGRALLDPLKILKIAGLDYGMRYADFGAGTLGHFVFPATDLVGQGGHVYAVDILKGALQGIESRKQLEEVDNLTTVWGDIERAGGSRLEEDSLHLISMIHLISLLRKSPQILDEVKRVLRHDGRFLLVDWNPDSGPVGMLDGTRMKFEEARKIIEQGPFEAERQFEAGPHHWAAIYKPKS